MNLDAFSGLSPFLDPGALAIVAGGTALAAALRTPLGDLRRALGALRVLVRRRFDVEPLLGQVTALTRIARRHGLIALDRSVIRDPDIAAVAAAIVDGAGAVEVERLLRERLAARATRHRAAADFWSAVGDLAPAMGMVGTLIGLVQMFTAMQDPAAIGSAMAIALLTTLYGALLANLLAMPIAARLRRRAECEAEARERLVVPLAALASVEPSISHVREVAA